MKKIIVLSSILLLTSCAVTKRYDKSFSSKSVENKTATIVMNNDVSFAIALDFDAQLAKSAFRKNFSGEAYSEKFRSVVSNKLTQDLNIEVIKSCSQEKKIECESIPSDYLFSIDSIHFHGRLLMTTITSIKNKDSLVAKIETDNEDKIWMTMDPDARFSEAIDTLPSQAAESIVRRIKRWK